MDRAQRVRPRQPHWCKFLDFIIKLVEILIVSLILVFHAKTPSSPLTFDLIHPYVVSLAFLFVTTVIIKTYIWEPKMPDILIGQIHVFGAILFFASGVIQLVRYTNLMDANPHSQTAYAVLGSGILSVMNGLAYGIDVFLIVLRKWQNGNENLYE